MDPNDDEVDFVEVYQRPVYVARNLSGKPYPFLRLGFEEEVADKYFNGHYTIFKFTTHYKVMFGTLEMDGVSRNNVRRTLVPAETIEHAIVNTVVNFDKDNITDPSYMKGR